MGPLVSVIVPTRGRLPFLKQTLQSILAQTYREMEVFVVADGHQPEVSPRRRRSQDRIRRHAGDGTAGAREK
jgi:GT2 family glycosyltransferase